MWSNLISRTRGKLRLVGYKSKKLPPAAVKYSISEPELCGLAVNIDSSKHILRNTKFRMIIDLSALLNIINAKRESPILRLKKFNIVLSLYSFKVEFLRGKDMTISDFLSRHPDHNLASPNEIIPISFQLRELLNNADKLDNIIEALKDLDRLNTMVDILCPAKKAPSPVRKVHKKDSSTKGELGPIWPMTGTNKEV